MRQTIVRASVLWALAAVSVHAQVIDFETLPGGAATLDEQSISDHYSTFGVVFTLVDPVTGDSIGTPRIAKTGDPLTAFEGCLAADTPHAYLGLGQSFLTDDSSLGVTGDLRIDYVAPVAQASGLILDIDCRVSGGAPCEQWTITAYDAADSVLEVVVLDGPEGPENLGCVSPHAGPGDSEAFGWSVGAGGPVITSILLSYTGQAPNVGLAFDSFTASGTPAALGVSAVAAVDSICSGEEVMLSAFPTGGLPPYSLQWQQETGPATWADIGSGPSLTVTPFVTTRYRVVVTDVEAQSASPGITVTVDEGSPLCSASLIIASTWNDRVLRHSLLSGQVEVFVESGAGGLNNTSKAVFGPDSDLYVSSQANDRVLRYDGQTGAFIDVFVSGGSGGLDVPVGLDFGPDGNLFVVSNGNHSVLRYDGSTGAFTGVFVPNGSGLNHPTDLVFGADDNLYVASRDSDKVLYFDGTTGAPLGDFVAAGSGGLDQPRGLDFGPDGHLYVCEETHDSVSRYDGTTGAFIDVFIAAGSGGLDRANDLVFAPSGVLYVASFNNDLVVAYDGATGAFLESVSSPAMDGPSWLAIGSPPAPPTAVPSLPAGSDGLSMEPPVPNPFETSTTIAFAARAGGRTRATIHDIRGRLVATLLDRDISAGRHTIRWGGVADVGTPAAAGVYFVRISSGGFGSTGRIVLVR